MNDNEREQEIRDDMNMQCGGDYWDEIEEIIMSRYIEDEAYAMNEMYDKGSRDGWHAGHDSAAVEYVAHLRGASTVFDDLLKPLPK